MKLNVDCVRDILLVIESAGFNETLTLSELVKKLPKHSRDEIHYTCVKLYEGKFINAELKPYPGKAIPMITEIKSLTYEGHKFIDTVRDNTIWKKTKNTISDIASVSFSILQSVASQLIMDAISGKLTS